jgi:uroporphyrin-3 C-methyltransferase
MSEETERSEDESPVPEPPAAALPGPRAESAPRRRGGAPSLIIALLALAVAGYALWRDMAREEGGDRATASLGARIDASAKAQAQLRRDIATQRARVDDADSVNNSLREELLNLTERSRHVEDAVANLAQQRLTGRDALALNEAEFLLQLGAERLALFRDPQATLAAYRLADSALAAAEDPVFASVRQSIGAEMHALGEARPLETTATLDALENVRSALASLPARPSVVAPAPAEASGLMKLLHQFVHVSRDAGQLPERRDPAFARTLAAIDVRAAEAAVLARDPQSYARALARLRADLDRDFDPAAAPVAALAARLAKLSEGALAPPLPELGTALRELRNLRATRALSRGKIVPDAPGSLDLAPPQSPSPLPSPAGNDGKSP